MPKIEKIEDTIVGSTRQVVDQQLDAVEGGVDHAIDSTKDTVHELRNEVEDIIDRAFERFKELWQDQQPKMEQFMASHPWLVLGGFLLVGYLIAGPRQGNRASSRM